MIRFSAEAIFASSTSKFGIRIPLTEHEDLRSSTDSTISTSLIHSIASVGNSEQVHTSVLNLIFQQANVAGLRNLSKWRSEICSRCWSAPLFFWKSSPHWGRMNFWLTVLTGITDPELVFGFHSLHVVIYVPLRLKSKDWPLLDKVLKKTLLDLQKRFPIYHALSQMLGGLSLRLGIPIDRLSIPPGSRKGGSNAGWLVTWDSPLRTDSASSKSLDSFRQLTSFCSSWILAVSSLK